MTELAPKPATPLTTVAPARPRARRSSSSAIGLPDEHPHQHLLSVDLPHDYTRTPTTSRPAAMPRKHTLRHSAVVTRTLTHA